MRRAHFFWRTLIAVAGAFAIAYAWRMAVAACAVPAPAAGGVGDAAGGSPVAAYTLWLAATLIAGWAAYWLGGLAGVVWWLACLRLAWGMAEPALSALGKAAPAVAAAGKAAAPAGLSSDLAGAWLLALMPIVGVVLGNLFGRRAYWTVPPQESYPPAEPPLPGPAAEVPPEGNELSAVRRQDFRRRDDAYR